MEISQKSKLNKEYERGFEDAVEFFELALHSTKFVGPKTRDRIHDRIAKVLLEANIIQEESTSGKEH